jgi:serine/threonine protein kinase
VKKLKPILGGQDKQFKNEVNHLARVNHDNIVKLVGYCDETKERHVYDEDQQKYIWAEIQDKLLCYEFMSKGSLDNYIFCKIVWHILIFLFFVRYIC